MPQFSKFSSHPDLETLALYSEGDLPVLAKLDVRRHLANCKQCDHEVSQFRESRVQLREETLRSGLNPTFSDWAHLEREMMGNIRVGVAASQAIQQVGRRGHVRWRTASLAITGFIAVILIWFINIPAEQSEHLASTLRGLVGLERTVHAGTVVETSPRGVTVRSRGSGLTLLHPVSAYVNVSVNGTSSVDARYVDDETGQVTITSVYGQ